MSWAAVAAALVIASLAGCASAPVPAPAAPPASSPPSPAAASGAPASAWALPAGALGSQRLYRVSFDGPDGDGSFRLTLLLDTAERYQVRAVDPLGRALWTLDTAGEGGLWSDHRNRVFCSLEGEFDLAAARLAPFPLAALPALLLGSLPAPAEGPVEVEAVESGGRRIAFGDAQGRRWTALLEEGRPAAWALYRGDEPSLLWSRDGDQAFLSDRLRGSQLRWRQTVVEAMTTPLPPSLAAEAPAGYSRVDCATAYEG